jgi:hypothetical protein
MAGDLVAIRVLESGFDGLVQMPAGVVETAAMRASDVVMGLDDRVVAARPVALIQPANKPLRREKLEVAVDGSKTDAGKEAPHCIVEFQRRWVCLRRAQFFKDHTPLTRLPRFSRPGRDHLLAFPYH